MKKHKPVLLKEAIQLLKINKGDTVIDATLGGGGHTREILKAVGKKGKVVAIDLDEKAIEDFEAKADIKKYIKEGRLFLKQGNFKNIKEILVEFKVDKVQAILADLGWRMQQVKDDSYGMSFRSDTELDMRFSKKQELTAKEIVNKFSAKELNNIFWLYGEEKESGKITRAIVNARKIAPINSTTRLVELIIRSKKQNDYKSKIHPATKIFQALRMAVNDEINNLKVFLNNSLNILKQGGRIAIISFHSLEDRLVKNFFRENARGCVCPKNFPICTCQHLTSLKRITKKPIIATKDEIDSNYNSRSARLRVAEKIESR